MQVTLTKQNVKKMAHLLKEFSATAAAEKSLAQCYETLAKMFDCKDWNTLSAKLHPEPELKLQSTRLFFEAENVSPLGSNPEYAEFVLTNKILANLQTNTAANFTLNVTDQVKLSWASFGLGPEPDLIEAKLHAGPASYGVTDVALKDREMYLHITAQLNKNRIVLQSYTFKLSLLEELFKLSIASPEIRIVNETKVISWSQGFFITPSTWSATKEFLELSLAFMPLTEEEYQLIWDLVEDKND